jgi:hypothetical protein
MRDFIKGIIEFNKATIKDAFIAEEKEVSSAIQAVLADVYLNDGDEIDLVKKTVETLNSSRSYHFTLESAFIHGNKSQIEFQYYGKKAHKELGDLLIVSTMTRRGTPLLQKLTIIQAKRDTRKACTWGIDKEQLFFLSNWPQFNGIRGIFPKRTLAIPDHSGCLGSYYLYREPGDFVFISARELEFLIGSQKRITFDDMLKNQTEIKRHSRTSHPSLSFPSIIHPEEFYDILEKYLYKYYKLGYPLPLFPHVADGASQILQNVCFCKNVNDSIGNFARLNIGEPIYSVDSIVPVNEFAYRMLNTVVRYVMRMDQGNLGRLRSFNAEAPYFEELDMEGVRVGVIHSITEVSPE